MKTIVITGASSGIGAALTLLYASRGDRVALVARRRERLIDLAKEVRSLGGEALVVVADVSKETDCERVIKEVYDKWSEVDVLINNAGRGNLSSVEETTSEQWRSIMAVNLDAPFFLTRGFLPKMKRRDSGHIINISSVAGTTGFPFNAAYVAAKHAVAGFTAGLRAELIDTNVLATVIYPAGVITEWGGVTEGGSINDFYSKAIPHSRTIARDRGIGLAPLSHMKKATEVAQLIVDVSDGSRSNDVFTHDGTMELATQAVEDRVELEDRHLSLWLAMKETYEQ
jgi:short-subunit dehydrogenase